MHYSILGNTRLKVSKLCFGALVMGPLQAGMPEEAGGEIILAALGQGVNFIDTAELYGTYGHIRHALKKWRGPMPVIATKSYAYTEQGARESLEKARKELDCDVIDIFMLHEQESRLTLRGHREALEYYIEQKQKGKIRAVGVSSHFIEAVDACAQMPEIDVIHPLVNIKGLGIGDGSVSDMILAIEKAYNNGKGIYAMKPLGGGNLLAGYEECMKFVLDIPCIHSIAVGMQSLAEVYANVCTFEGRSVPAETQAQLRSTPKKLHVDFWCTGCGECEKTCGQHAIKVIDGKARVDLNKCVLCGYCSGSCPEFAIKVC